MFKYYLIFNAVFYLLQISVAVIEFLLDFRIGIGASIGALFASGILAGRSFVTDRGHLPTRGEKWRLVLGSYFSNLLISLTLSVLVLVFLADARLLVAQVIEELGLVTLGIILAVISLVYLGVLYFTYGFLLRKIMGKAGHVEETDQERREPRLP